MAAAKHETGISGCRYRARLETLGGAMPEVFRAQQVVERNVHLVRVAEIVIAIRVSQPLRVDLSPGVPLSM